MIRILPPLTAAYFCLSSVALAEPIVSTATGGPWSSPATWVGGVVPGSLDDAQVNGPVQVDGTRQCQNLSVNATGTLSSVGAARLQVGSSVANHGTIENGATLLYVEIGGDLENQGLWSNFETILTGSSDHHLVQGAGASLEGDLTLDAAATGDVIADTPFDVVGDVDLGGGRILLSPGADLTLSWGYFRGDLECNGNTLDLTNAILLEGNVDSAVLAGNVAVTSAVSFTRGVTVTGVFRNSPGNGNANVSIAGRLVNQGLIHNDSYGLTLDLSGDLTNDGDVTCSFISLDGSADHHLSMGPSGNLATLLMLPEFGAGTLVGETDLHITDGISLGADGTMILAEGSTVTFSSGGSVSGGTLLANGSTLVSLDTAHLALDVVDGATLDGLVQLSRNVEFTGGLTVKGTVQGWSGAVLDVTVDGSLVNGGTIRDNVQALNLTVRGDVLNAGTLENSRIVLDGSIDQRVTLDGTITVPDFVLASGLSAATFQWFRDGSPLAGETSASLSFPTVTPADAGIYHCVGDGAQTSRLFLLGGSAVDVAPRPPVTATFLEPARPNPFRGSTRLSFSLADPGRVRLTVVDVAGRRVATIIDSELPRGSHVAEWGADGLATGAYFFRLETPDHASAVKGLLLR